VCTAGLPAIQVGIRAHQIAHRWNADVPSWWRKSRDEHVARIRAEEKPMMQLKPKDLLVHARQVPKDEIEAEVRKHFAKNPPVPPSPIHAPNNWLTPEALQQRAALDLARERLALEAATAQFQQSQSLWGALGGLTSGVIKPQFFGGAYGNGSSNV
jgi:hypothetical protein